MKGHQTRVTVRSAGYLVLVATLRLIGANSNTVFSSVASPVG